MKLLERSKEEGLKHLSKTRYQDNFYRYTLEEASCDECCEPVSLLEYYNYDGLCDKCFLKWVSDNE